MGRHRVKPRPSRPWLLLRRGETEAERQARLMSSCAGCGEQDPNQEALAEHEVACLAEKQGHRTDLEEHR